MAGENILIIAVRDKNKTDSHFISSLEEIKSLSQTAGGVVCDVITQNRDHIHPVTYVGEGKVTEVKQSIESLDIDLDRKSTRLNSSHVAISYAVFCLQKKN